MTEKYSLFPAQSYQLTPAQTTLQWLSEKHPDFEIKPVSTISPPPQILNIHKHPRHSCQLIHHYQLSESILQQSDIETIVKSIESHVIHGLELPIQAQDLIKAFQTSTHF